MKYRTLKATDTIQKGDEFESSKDEWRPVGPTIGRKVGIESVGYFRRPIHNTVKPVSEPNYKSLCKRMAKAPSIREARAMYAEAIGACLVLAMFVACTTEPTPAKDVDPVCREYGFSHDGRDSSWVKPCDSVSGLGTHVTAHVGHAEGVK